MVDMEFWSLVNTKAKKNLWNAFLQLMWEVEKGCSERKKRFMNSIIVKPGKYDHTIHLFYNITIYTTIFNLVIDILVGRCMQNSLLELAYLNKSKQKCKTLECLDPHPLPTLATNFILITLLFYSNCRDLSKQFWCPLDDMKNLIF